MRIPVILADYPAGTFPVMILLWVTFMCLLLAGLFHKSGNHIDRNRFLRVAKICALVGIVWGLIGSMFGKYLDLP